MYLRHINYEYNYFNITIFILACSHITALSRLRFVIKIQVLKPTSHDKKFRLDILVKYLQMI